MKKNKLNLAIIFGAKSCEHEVSIVTAFQAWDWINPQKYHRFLIYIDDNNQTYLCPSFSKKDYRHFIKKTLQKKHLVNFVKKGMIIRRGFFKKKVNIDAALLLMHGSYGEDGRIQGMLDFLEIPYTGSGVLGSSLGMDKVVMKDIFVKMGLRVTPYEWFWDDEFKNNPQKITTTIEKNLQYPLFVKPANGGSSVGVSKVKNRRQLEKAIKTASKFDHKILVEQSVEKAVDINCALMGGYQPTVSVCEQPLSEDQFLSFREKYLKGGKTKGMAGLSRIVPAPISSKATREIQEIAKLIFRELGCWGMARMDFLYQEKTGKIYPNEINTIPGSLSFYLWQASGIKPPQLIDKMVELALQKEKETNRLSYTFKSKILDQK